MESAFVAPSPFLPFLPFPSLLAPLGAGFPFDSVFGFFGVPVKLDSVASVYEVVRLALRANVLVGCHSPPGSY